MLKTVLPEIWSFGSVLLPQITMVRVSTITTICCITNSFGLLIAMLVCVGSLSSISIKSELEKKGEGIEKMG